MIDLHTHSTFSDGVLIPAELARRARHAGYRAIAITDHADASTMGHALRCLAEIGPYGPLMDLDILVGVEITHVPPGLVAESVARARELGAQIVVVHGETLVEPVAAGTNLAAIEAGCDILAHPGLLTEAEARLAAERGVHLEITTRKGHALANGHVAAMARRCGAMLVVNNDAHAPGDLVSADMRKKIALGAGLALDEWRAAEENAARLLMTARQRGRDRPAP